MVPVDAVVLVVVANEVDGLVNGATVMTAGLLSEHEDLLQDVGRNFSVVVTFTSFLEQILADEALSAEDSFFSTISAFTDLLETSFLMSASSAFTVFSISHLTFIVLTGHFSSTSGTVLGITLVSEVVLIMSSFKSPVSDLSSEVEGFIVSVVFKSDSWSSKLGFTIFGGRSIIL